LPVLKLCHAPRLDLPLKLVNRYLSAYGGQAPRPFRTRTIGIRRFVAQKAPLD
jgi:hypothetical protein